MKDCLTIYFAPILQDITSLGHMSLVSLDRPTRHQQVQITDQASTNPSTTCTCSCKVLLDTFKPGYQHTCFDVQIYM